VTLSPGEAHKTVAAAQSIWDAALAARVDRHTVVLGFGGGVVGDLAGFAASTILRGVRAVLVPTTLLAMVDASVGGKTGFDHAMGKNLIGTFHQPSSVVVDLAHLATLAKRELRAGLAEVAKIALACDEGLWRELESGAETLVAGNVAQLARVITASIRLKSQIVRADEQEAGVRRVLNLGHTVGHGIEAAAGYSRFVHGEAVALGMLVELTATERLGWTPPGVSSRVRALLERLELPTRISNSELAPTWEYMASDKKRVAATLQLPVVRTIGTTSVEVVDMRDFRDAVGAGLEGNN
jgi:shikimate kinase / 3-dehydroquinate synthase